jgi:hypothetical protein
MKQVSPRNIIFFVILLSLFGLHSCAPEKKLAKSFVDSGMKRSALLLATDNLFKTSLKTDILDSLEFDDESRFDSVLLANSEFLNDIDDVLFIQNFMLGIEKELKEFDFNVYKEEQMSQFMEVDSNAFVIYLAQLELEESYYPFKDQTEYMGSFYYHEHMLNAASLYTWFEISEVNKEKTKNVYFAEDVIVDEVDGEFTLDFFGGEVKYFYEIDTLKTNDLYKFAYNLGRKYAGYTFDLLLNNYIRENMDNSPKYYLRYDPFYKNFFEATDDRFILLEE